MRSPSSLTMMRAFRSPCGPLRPHRVRPPRLDAFLDVVATFQIAVQNRSRQSRKLGFIAAETESDQLTAGELPDLATQIVRQAPLQTQSLFEPDQTILNHEHHPPRGQRET